jgi:hypothetical protein
MDEKPLRKINYFTGFFLQAEDLQAAESYRDRVRMTHNLLFHGPGVVRGFRDELAVTLNDRGNEITVGTGFAIDLLGRELLLATPSTHVIRHDEYKSPATLYVTLGYTSKEVDPRVNQGNPDYKGNAFVEEGASVTITTTEPDEASLELGRIHLTGDGTRVRPDQIDMTHRSWSGIAGSTFRLDKDAELVKSGNIFLSGRATAELPIEEVKGENRARVFAISVYPCVPGHIRWHQEAETTEREAKTTERELVTTYQLVIENQESNETDVHYNVYRFG